MVKSALMMVDLQKDFCPGGSLAAPEGDLIIPIANALASRFELVVASLDWHPSNHASFASNHPNHKVGDVIMINNIPQVLWPNHCVQDSPGSGLHPDLLLQAIDHYVYKGVDAHIDSYSVFFDNHHLRSTGLNEYLRAKEITTIYLLGLVTDYCVKYSALDARNLGFEVFVIVDACRGVEVNPGDVAKAYQEMQAAGVKLIYSRDVLTTNQ